MANKESDLSLVEIAYKLLSKKRKPQLLEDIIKDVMSTKGYKPKEAREVTPQFILDFQSCGDFIYCGDGRWDLKERQPTSVLDKDGSDYDYFDDEDVLRNELKDDDFLGIHVDESVLEDEDDHLDNEDEDVEDDDLAAEFENLEDEEDTDDDLDLDDEDLDFDDDDTALEDELYEYDDDEDDDQDDR